MNRRLRVIAAFAVIGFGISWLLMAFYAIAQRSGHFPSTAPFLYLCPPSIFSLGLEGASVPVGLFWWLVISLMNAILYSLGGGLLSLFIARRKQNAHLSASGPSNPQ